MGNHGMRLSMVKRLVLVAAMLSGICGVAFVALIAWLAYLDPLGGAPHAGDAELIEQFRRQRPALEALVGSIGASPLVERVAADFTRPEAAPVAPVLLAAWRRELADAGIARGFSHYGDTIFFMVSTRGLAIAGSAKGFLHSDSAELRDDAVVVDGDLDAAAAEPGNREGALLVRRLDAQWWLALDTR